MGCVAADDGTFHIPYEDYLRDYAWTSVAVDMDKDYQRSGIFKQFTEGEN